MIDVASRENSDKDMITSLLYISRSKIASREAESVIKEIVAAAVVANQRRGLTGALLFTGVYFAQVLEGRSDEIEPLLAKLSGDARHDQLKVVTRLPVTERLFEGWSLAYLGPSQFVARHVTRLLNEPSPGEQARAGNWLKELMLEFTTS